MRHRFVIAFAMLLSFAALASDPLTAAGPTKLFTLAIAAVVLALQSAIAGWRRSSKPQALSVADSAGLGFLGLSSLSLLWGTRAGLIDLALWTTGLTIVVVLRRHAFGFRVRVLEATTALTCGASATYAIVERLLHRESAGGHGNPDWLGLTLAIGLPVCVQLARNDRRRPLGIALIGVVLVGLYLSHSRTGWVAAAIATAVVFAAPCAKAATSTSTTSLLFAGPGLGGHLGAFHEADVGRAFAGRLWIYERSVEVVISHPILGVGLGRFGFGYLEEQGRALSLLKIPDAARGFVNATTAHDDYLQLACESGIPSAICFAVFLARTASALFSRATYGALGAVVAFAICALGDSPLRLPAPVLLLALAVASSHDAAPRWALARGPALLRGVRMLRNFVPVFAVLGGVVAALQFTSARLRTRASLSASPAQGKLLSRAAEFDLTGEAELDLGLYRLAQGAEQAAAAERHLRASSARLPNVGTFVALGNALYAQRRDPDAKEAYERAIALNPGSLKAHLNLSEVDRRLGRRAEARKHAEAARLIAPYHPKLLDLFDRLESDAAVSEELERIDVDDDTDRAR